MFIFVAYIVFFVVDVVAVIAVFALDVVIFFNLAAHHSACPVCNSKH